MSTTPAAPKHQKPSKAAAKTRGWSDQWLLPLVVDAHSMTVLPLEFSGSEVSDKDLGTLLSGSYVFHTALNRPNTGGVASDVNVLILSNKTSGANTSKLSKLIAELRRHGDIDKRHAIAEPVDFGAIKAVFERTLESLKEVHLRSPGQHLAERELIRQVAESMVDKAGAPSLEPSIEEGWQRLLERGLESKTSLLRSKVFKSTSEASALVGVGEPAVRKRIRDHKLFAMKMPGDGEHRIPAWALDTKVAGSTTETLLADAEDADEWHLYHFLTTPNGSLNGLRPFECLMSGENLPSSRKAARDELASYLKLPPNASLLSPVRQALKAELEDSASA